MDNFNTQYEKELAYQEITSNKYTLYGIVLFIGVELLIWLLNIIGFFELDNSIMSAVIGSSIVLFIPIILIMVKGDLSNPAYKYIAMTQICIITGTMITFLSYHAILLSVLPLLFAGHYRKRSVLWYTYVLSAITLQVSSVLNYYFGIMDINLLIAGTHQKNWYLNIVANGGSFTYNENPVFIILIFAGIPRCLILLVFTFMMQYIVTSIQHDAARIAQLTYLKETDSLTKLFNKNKYNEMVSMYYPNVDNITVIFWDLNNLKIINDTYGHEFGDKALATLASVLYTHSDERRRIYRFGGDEFVMIIDNPHDGEAERIISAVKDELVKSSAVGVASGKGSDIIEIVKNADSAMYADKQLCHHRELENTIYALIYAAGLNCRWLFSLEILAFCGGASYKKINIFHLIG